MAQKKKKPNLFERQYKTVSRRFDVTREEFREYYDELRRANKKGSRIRREVKGKLYVPEFSYTTAALRTREDFEHYLQAVKQVNAVDYLQKVNLRIRKQMRINLKQEFGQYTGESMFRELDKLSDKDLNNFLSAKINSDWQTVAYDSKTQILDFIDLSLADLKSRIKTFDFDNPPPKKESKRNKRK